MAKKKAKKKVAKKKKKVAKKKKKGAKKKKRQYSLNKNPPVRRFFVFSKFLAKIKAKNAVSIS